MTFRGFTFWTAICLTIWSLPFSHAADSTKPLRISVSPMPVSAPVLLARELGWFKKAGLNVDLKEYPLGKIALQDMSNGKLDLACAAVTPLVHRCLAGEDFRILATIASSTGMVAIVARKDAGIQRLADLTGKRIGLSKGTSGEFFFETLRILHRLPRTGLQVEDRSLDRLVSGLQDSSLDAVSIWETQISELNRAMPGRLTLFYGNGLYNFVWNLVALPSTIADRRPEIQKFLTVLDDTARFIEAEGPAAREHLRRLGQHGDDLANFLDQVQGRPVLSQDLLIQLEAETRWVLARDGRTNSVPNYLRFLDRLPLEAVNPSAVTLIK